MKAYLLVLPVAFLVAYSQLSVKWRVAQDWGGAAPQTAKRLVQYLGDPYIISAYLAALFASFAWLFVITKLPLVTAFPIYIGVTFAFVMFGGWLILGEELSLAKVFAAALILTGIIIGIGSSN